MMNKPFELFKFAYNFEWCFSKNIFSYVQHKIKVFSFYLKILSFYLFTHHWSFCKHAVLKTDVMRTGFDIGRRLILDKRLHQK